MNYLSKLKKIVFAFAILFSFGYFTSTALAVSDDVTVIVLLAATATPFKPVAVQDTVGEPTVKVFVLVGLQDKVPVPLIPYIGALK